MSHILNISTHYIQTKSYFGVKQMIRNSEKLAHLNFEINRCPLEIIMLAIGDSIRYVNTINFSKCVKYDEVAIIDFYSRMEYPVNIEFPCLFEGILLKIMEMNKRPVQKRLSLCFYYFTDNTAKAVSALKPTEINFYYFAISEALRIFGVLKNTRIESINLSMDNFRNEKLDFDFSDYPNLKNLNVYQPNHNKIQMNIAKPEKPFDSLIKVINASNFCNFPDNLFFPYLEKICVTEHTDLGIFENKIFPREMQFGYRIETLSDKVGFWPSVEIITFGKIPLEFDHTRFPNLQRIILAVPSAVPANYLDIFDKVPKTIEIDTSRIRH